MERGTSSSTGNDNTATSVHELLKAKRDETHKQLFMKEVVLEINEKSESINFQFKTEEKYKTILSSLIGQNKNNDDKSRRTMKWSEDYEAVKINIGDDTNIDNYQLYFAHKEGEPNPTRENQMKVAHSGNAFTILKSIHEDKGHIKDGLYNVML